jgi:hypothetical protein
MVMVLTIVALDSAGMVGNSNLCRADLPLQSGADGDDGGGDGNGNGNGDSDRVGDSDHSSRSTSTSRLAMST